MQKYVKFFIYYINFRLQIYCETWSKDAFELIDYECSKLIPINLETRIPGTLKRTLNNIIIETNSNSTENKNSEKLLDITCNEKNFFLNTNNLNSNKINNLSNSNYAWFIFNSIKSEDKIPKKYQLNEGDIIKIGRIILKIKQIKLNDQMLLNNNQNINHTNINNSEITNVNNLQTENVINNLKSAFTIPQKTENSSLSKKKLKKLKICRICYGEDDEPNSNPLLQPCICKGSMKYIHLKCLKKCINTRTCVKINSNKNCSVYNIKRIECELCKTELPDFIKHNGKLYEILDFNNDFENYITIESLSIDKHKNKYLYVVNLDKTATIKIGRGHESNLLLSDISVSRFHCSMTLDKNKIYLVDNESKFGTLVLIQNNSIKLNNEIPLNIQIGRTFCHFKIKKKIKLFTCCNVEEKLNYNYYYLQNSKMIDIHKKISIKNNDDDSISSNEDEDNKCDIKINYKEEKNLKNNKENLNNEIMETNDIQRFINFSEENEINNIQLDTENQKNIYIRKTMVNE